MEERRQIKVFPVSFEIYAYDETEVEELRKAVVAFIGSHARQGRAVDARRLAQAVASWDRNPFVRNKVIEYFK